MKKSKVLMLISVMFVLLISNVVLADFVKEGDFTKYEENGAFKTNDWLEIKGDHYYFDANSHMVTGLQKIGNYYYVFGNNGIAYKRTKTFTFDDVEYDIGAKGKVKDLELHITDEQYNNYIAQKAVEDANSKAFKEAQKALNESIAAVQKEQEALRQAENAALESQRAIEQSKNAEIKAQEDARNEYLLSKENANLIIVASNKGNTDKKVIDNVYTEINRQLSLRKIELIQKAKDMRAVDPMVELYFLIEDYNAITKRYASTVDGILSALAYKYNLNEQKLNEYTVRFTTLFENMKTAFETELDKTVG